MNTDTPETESWCGWGIGGLQVVPASFSRKIERERDEALEQRDSLAKALRVATAYPLSESWYKQAIDALATLKPCD
jgi:hypothetical protein